MIPGITFDFLFLYNYFVTYVHSPATCVSQVCLFFYSGLNNVYFLVIHGLKIYLKDNDTETQYLLYLFLVLSLSERKI
jgi:hypothetical protein